MKWDFRHHLLAQIEMLRGDISHEELSSRLGDVTERCLARYIAGKTFLNDDDIRAVAKALGVDAQILARAWAASLGLRAPDRDAVSWMARKVYGQWQQFSPGANRGVPSNPSPMAVIRARYADRLPVTPPPLWLGANADNRRRRDTPENRARFVRAYEMLVDSVHGGMSARDIGAMRGISGERARQLMVAAAYAWARSERINLSGKLVPFKKDARAVKNLYAGLRFFGQQQFHELTAKDATRGRPPRRR
ncbi:MULTISPECIES: helix-turn-helix transcriptional regulator [Acidobacterium]|nr:MULTISPECIES: helix-turn-helix transcriptional regulator [Acidobacterium]HCT60019.1 XRE family transcriptional regulator [Acidobacterium sp.]